MKSWVKSKTIWLNGSASVLFGMDAVQHFLASGALDTVCAKKSAFASAIALASVGIRFITSQPIGKEEK